MIEEHNPINTESFAKEVKDSFLSENELKTYPNLAEIANLKEVVSAYVFVTVVSVFFDNIDSNTPGDHSILVKAVYDILTENTHCRDVSTQGNYVIGIFDTPFKTDIDMVLDSVGKIKAVFNIAKKIRKSTQKDEMKIGVGMAYSKTLMSLCTRGDNPVINWSGGAVDTAIKYSTKAAEESSRVYATYTIYNNLKESYQKLFKKEDSDKYSSQPVNIAMDNWSKSNV
mgnify:CR=1 FL=1